MKITLIKSAVIGLVAGLALVALTGLGLVVKWVWDTSPHVIRLEPLPGPYDKYFSKGFTLLELLTAMAILGLLVALLFAVFQSTTTMFSKQENRTEVNQVTRALLHQISQDIGAAMPMPRVSSLHYVSNSWLSGQLPCDTLHVLSDLPLESRGGAIGISYQMQSITNIGPPVRQGLFRGNDPAVWVDQHPLDWWDFPQTPPHWKMISENVVGVKFSFHTNNALAMTAGTNDSFNAWNGTTISNRLPNAVTVELWLLDTTTYKQALQMDTNLVSAASQAKILGGAVHAKTRVFLPRGGPN